MITARTKRQLLIFLVITVVGVTYVGARYARLDRLFYDSSYSVTAHFKESGGIFTDAEVTYRGVQVGRVEELKLTDAGVDVVLSIEKDHDDIPADSLALVGNKSAVGEQYVELQPQSDQKPYLKEKSEIAADKTSVPVSTTEILTNLDNLVQSVPQSDLRTVVAESGAAFQGAGPDLARIIDTSTSFIDTANANFETTQKLIRDSRVLLQTQVDKESAIRSFSRDLSLFTGTVADSDRDLRRLIDEGSATANELRRFLENNRVNLGELISQLVTTNEVVVKHLDGIRQVLVIYPYVVAGGYTVAARQTTGEDKGAYNARFGLILQQQSPTCSQGYLPKRDPRTDREDRPLPEDVGCRESGTNLRGAEKTPSNRTGTAYRSPVATYDAETGDVQWTDPADGQVAYDGGAAKLFGDDSWKWTLLQPALPDDQE
ncbi:MCE family protein [Nocardioides aurantiacus]|uniref:Phospholipid/cholesterol/gamma-HCH transport system substrate-binding protein n=1 Tax=Nocardioides aurantiacus TaxID=86796 RepID=A0A3N2CQ21_9ACTN|nr:MlaD family protein [Nocardioides aurantiacus]ROR89589.1 phospholipid/cholesterol/gamma-HCH transport system substrate-binding protein [Nocardioides aurantiacus]